MIRPHWSGNANCQNETKRPLCDRKDLNSEDEIDLKNGLNKCCKLFILISIPPDKKKHFGIPVGESAHLKIYIGIIFN